MGRQEAANQADRTIGSFHDKHGLGNMFTRLSGKIGDLCHQHLDWVGQTFITATEVQRDYRGRSLSQVEKQVIAAVQTKDEDGTTNVYAKTPDKLLRLWMDSEFNPSSGGKLKWKSSELANQLPPVKRTRIGHHWNYPARLIGTIVDGEFVPAR